MPLVNDADLKKIIEDGDNEVLINRAEEVGRTLKEKPYELSTSQIRSVFGSVRRIELDWRNDDGHNERAKKAQREFALLRPRLAYQAGREKKTGVRELERVLRPAMELVGKKHERFRNFVDFFEAILAYHKAAGGQ